MTTLNDGDNSCEGIRHGCDSPHTVARFHDNIANILCLPVPVGAVDVMIRSKITPFVVRIGMLKTATCADFSTAMSVLESFLQRSKDR